MEQGGMTMLASELPLNAIQQELRDLARPVGETTRQRLTALFFSLEDAGEPGQVLFVFGSRKGFRYRGRLAAELYRAGRAPVIFVSGGTRDPLLPAEAAVFRRELLKLGIPSRDILTEEQSRTTPENVAFSAPILRERYGNRPLRLILVTAAFHMTRAYGTAVRGFPHQYRFQTCPASTGWAGRDSWFDNPRGRERMALELQSLLYCIGRGWTMDVAFQEESLSAE